MEFLKNYTEAIDINFPGALHRTRELGMDAAYFPLHARTIGTDVAVAALFTPNDFYMFFVADRDKDIAIWEDVDDAPEFNRDWTFNTPDEMRSEQALDHLGVSRSSILPPSDRYDSINIPGTNFIAQPIESIVLDARSHGTVVGNEAGQRAEAALPRLLGVAERKQALAQFRERYEYLRDSSMRPQSRGQQFEKLWRDLLDF